MARNWLRACSLTLSGNSQKAISGGGPTDLRIVFVIEPSAVQSPNPARFLVYNPSPTTVALLKAKEFTTLSFSAGYEGNSGLIYSGDIKQSIYGHENAVDSYVEIFCAGGDQAYLAAKVNKTLAAGYTPQDQWQAAVDAMSQYNVTMGLTNVDLSTPKYPRGIPLFAMARDIMREVASSKGALWSIQNGQINLIDNTKPISGSPFVMNSSTGMIGWPQQTENGIYVKSLLNASLQPNSLLQISQSSIIEAEQNNNAITGAGSTQNLNLQNTGMIAADGIYRVFYMERRGDTRGQEWFDLSTCLATAAFPNQQELDTQYLGQS